jgi:hypothetical protein
VNRDWARAFLPHPSPAAAADVAIDVPMPKEPGRYALRFDLVAKASTGSRRAAPSPPSGSDRQRMMRRSALPV